MTSSSGGWTSLREVNQTESVPQEVELSMVEELNSHINHHSPRYIGVQEKPSEIFSMLVEGMRRNVAPSKLLQLDTATRFRSQRRQLNVFRSTVGNTPTGNLEVSRNGRPFGWYLNQKEYLPIENGPVTLRAHILPFA